MSRPIIVAAALSAVSLACSKQAEPTPQVVASAATAAVVGPEVTVSAKEMFSPHTGIDVRLNIPPGWGQPKSHEATFRPAGSSDSYPSIEVEKLTDAPVADADKVIADLVARYRGKSVVLTDASLPNGRLLTAREAVEGSKYEQVRVYCLVKRAGGGTIVLFQGATGFKNHALAPQLEASCRTMTVLGG